MSIKWQKALSKLSTAEFHGDFVTIKNVRDCQYKGSESEAATIAKFDDRTYDLRKLVRVWYVSTPFQQTRLAAHTFLSFEFSDGSFLCITIEARKRVGQVYNLFKGAFRAYPLIYIAADERDVIFVRTNIRKDDVYLFPVRATKQKVRALFEDMLKEMNQLALEPAWYNTIWNNCTSRIIYHINRVTPHRLPRFVLASFVTGLADKLAFDHGFIDTELSLEQARKKYAISKRAREVGYAEDFSRRIRQNLENSPS
jgi:hypothetical protein